LGLQAGLVDENAGIGVESGEREGNVGVDETDLRGRDPRVLKLHRRALLAAQYHYVAAFDGYCACT